MAWSHVLYYICVLYDSFVPSELILAVQLQSSWQGIAFASTNAVVAIPHVTASSS